MTSNLNQNPRLRHRLRVMGPHDEWQTKPVLGSGELKDLELHISMLESAALALGGTIAIVSGPKEVQTVISYPVNINRQPTA